MVKIWHWQNTFKVFNLILFLFKMFKMLHICLPRLIYICHYNIWVLYYLYYILIYHNSSSLNLLIDYSHLRWNIIHLLYCHRWLWSLHAHDYHWWPMIMIIDDHNDWWWMMFMIRDDHNHWCPSITDHQSLMIPITDDHCHRWSHHCSVMIMITDDH